MKIDRVTFTGADDSTDIKTMLAISQDFPETEWGILISASQEGSPRFPSLAWMRRLAEAICSEGVMPKLSCHFCGRWVRALMRGDDTILRLDQVRGLPFDRWQFNFHGSPHDFNIDRLALVLPRDAQQFIIQFDAVNEGVLIPLQDRGLNAVQLFDLSGGAGLVPDQWPVQRGNAHKPEYCGYAGGLGPDNIQLEMERIGAKTFTLGRIWIDMERNIRSQDDLVFDLDKCLRVLRQVREYTYGPGGKK